MTGVCRATKRNGEPCTIPANGPQGLCWAHDPKNAERRRRGASRGGKARANREIPAIKARLEDLEERVLSGHLETARAAVANQLLNTRLRAVEVERKLREQEDVLSRLEALERARKQERKGGRRWAT